MPTLTNPSVLSSPSRTISQLWPLIGRLSTTATDPRHSLTATGRKRARGCRPFMNSCTVSRIAGGPLQPQFLDLIRPPAPSGVQSSPRLTSRSNSPTIIPTLRQPPLLTLHLTILPCIQEGLGQLGVYPSPHSVSLKNRSENLPLKHQAGNVGTPKLLERPGLVVTNRPASQTCKTYCLSTIRPCTPWPL